MSKNVKTKKRVREQARNPFNVCLPKKLINFLSNFDSWNVS